MFVGGLERAARFSAMLSKLYRLVGSRGRGSPASNETDRRRYARAQVCTPVTVTANGQRAVGHVNDVSISGALLTVALDLEVDDVVHLELDRLSTPIEARVVRLTAENFGLAFADPGVAVIFAGWSRGIDTGQRLNGH